MMMMTIDGNNADDAEIHFPGRENELASLGVPTSHLKQQ